MRRQRQQNHPPLSIYIVCLQITQTHFIPGKHSSSTPALNIVEIGVYVYDVVGYMDALPWRRQAEATNHHIGGTMVQWQQTLLKSLIGAASHFTQKSVE